jgi:hypothetical protein
MHGTRAKEPKPFTSATSMLGWCPVNREGTDEPLAVFDPEVWRALVKNVETRPPVKRRF